MAMSTYADEEGGVEDISPPANRDRTWLYGPVAMVVFLSFGRMGSNGGQRSSGRFRCS